MYKEKKWPQKSGRYKINANIVVSIKMYTRNGTKRGGYGRHRQVKNNAAPTQQNSKSIVNSCCLNFITHL